MKTRGKKVIVAKHLIPHLREEQCQKRERAQQETVERKAAAATQKRQKNSQTVARTAAAKDELAKKDKELKNMSIADILNASKKLGQSKKASGKHVGPDEEDEDATTRTTAASTRRASAPQPQPKIHQEMAKGKSSSSSALQVIPSPPSHLPASLSMEFFLSKVTGGTQPESQGESDEASVNSANNSDVGLDASPPPTHKPSPGRYPRSPTKLCTVRNNCSLSPLAQPNFGALPLDNDGKDMEATSNLDGADGVSDLEEMRAVSDTDFGGPPPGIDSEGFLLGDGGYGMCYDDKDDEMGDGRDGAPIRTTTTTSYIGLDEGSLSGHESDLYAPSRGASPMRVDKGGSEPKKSKKSTPKSVAESTKKKQDKAALRRKIIAKRANPPPPHVAAPEVQCAKSGTKVSKSGSKRKDIESEEESEMFANQRGRRSERKLAVVGVDSHGAIKNKEKERQGKAWKATPSTTDIGNITFKDIDVDLAAQGKVAKPKKNYTITNIPFANPPVDSKHFKEKFIPSIYNWAGSRAVSQPFSTTRHPDLKATITDLWCNSVFKHLTPLESNGTRRVDNTAVLAVISKTARANTNTICDKLFTTKEEVAEWASHQLDKNHFLYLDFDNKDLKATGAFLSPLVLIPFGYFCQCVRGALKTYGLPYAGLALSAAAAMHSLFLRQEGVIEAGKEDNVSNNNPNSFCEDPWGEFSAGFFEQINKHFTIETCQAVIIAAEPYMTKKKGKGVSKAVERGGKEKLSGVRPSLWM
ncbi:hypothetical protein CPB85DRAFT_1438967 [Mucidula mucida]|nr:hypothetical protein CPB85DRAFT_1438967 [Mucidula mucida]